MQNLDTYIWNAVGYYGLSALVYSIEHCLAGKEANSEYVSEPMFTETEQLTEEEQLERDLKEEIRKMELWIANDKLRGLPETVIDEV